MGNFIFSLSPNLLTVTRNDICKSAFEASMIEFQEYVKIALCNQRCTNIVQTTENERDGKFYNLSFTGSCMFDFFVQMRPNVTWKENSATEVDDVRIATIGAYLYEYTATEIAVKFNQIYRKTLTKAIHRYMINYTEQTIFPKELFNIILDFYIFLF